ncbi:MAG: amino-acid N-acetyltransferase [Promicromonosporaceae bacterium]|jgi:amino-acid N-acetyltransferase|nr:amino-acid N-acetyltransferase [Promicromonosporaceae bacterium]
MQIVVRPARPGDVPAMFALVEPYARQRILLGKEMVDLYESIAEFVVAEADGELVGCGALHVLWADIAEIRTLAVAPNLRGTGVGHRLVAALTTKARDYQLERVFCLTFEVDFFRRQGFEEIDGTPVSGAVYQELLRSRDLGVAEFLDLASAKPNTLGNSRMLLTF